MKLKNFGKCLLFPHIALIILLLPISAVALTYSMLFLESTDPIRIASYVLSFYTLTIWCIRIPNMIRFFKALKSDNKYIKKWLGDVRLRANVTLTGNVLWNGAYATLQLGLGIYYSSVWYYSLFVYYSSLALMRFFIVRHTLRHKPGENIDRELRYYKFCGLIFLIMNTALSAMMLYMIRDKSTVGHHEIITISMAVYTFTTLTMAIINLIRYRKYKSPALSASKAISLASACVSMLTLENTMLATFGDSSMTQQTRSIFLALSGGAVSIFIIIMAVYMIVQSNSKSEI